MRIVQRKGRMEQGRPDMKEMQRIWEQRKDHKKVPKQTKSTVHIKCHSIDCRRSMFDEEKNE